MVSDTELLGVLSRKLASYMGLLSLASPDRGMASVSVTLLGSPPSCAIPADTVDIRRVEKSGSKVQVIPVTEKDRLWHLSPKVMRVGQSLVSAGGASDPIAGDVLTLYVDDAPVAITTLGQTIDARFPVQCHELLVLDLALYCSAKDEGRNPSEYERLSKERDLHFGIFTALMQSPSGALSSPHGRPAPEKA